MNILFTVLRHAFPKFCLVPLIALLFACGGGGGGGGVDSGGITSKSWRQAVSIDLSALDADDPEIAIDASGNAFAVWVESDATGVDSIMANRYDAATDTWGTAALIEPNSGEALGPQIAMDVTGNAIAVWAQSDATGVDSIVANRYDAATGAWGTAELIETNGGHANDPEIAMDATGNAIAAWAQRDGSGVTSIVANRFDAATGAWGTAGLIETNSGGASDPEIAVNASGIAFVVWVQRDAVTNDFDIWANRYDSATEWGTTATLIETGSGDSFDPDIVVDANGFAVAAWQQSDGTGVYHIWVNRYDVATGHWGVPAPIDTSSGDASDPELAVDAAGNTVAVWTQRDAVTNDFDVWINRYDASAGLWGTANVIETSSGDASRAEIAMDAAGNAIAVWVQPDGTGVDSILANRYDAATGTWGAVIPIETDGGRASGPELAMNASGDAFVVWEQDNGMGGDDIMANSYR